MSSRGRAGEHSTKHGPAAADRSIDPSGNSRFSAWHRSPARPAPARPRGGSAEPLAAIAIRRDARQKNPGRSIVIGIAARVVHAETSRRLYGHLCQFLRLGVGRGVTTPPAGQRIHRRISTFGAVLPGQSRWIHGDRIAQRLLCARGRCDLALRRMPDQPEQNTKEEGWNDDGAQGEQFSQSTMVR